MAKTTKPSRSLASIRRDFDTPEACKAHLAKLRWPDGTVVCPRCGETKRVYALKTRPFHWVCKNPSEACPGVYRFSVLTGTVFENTNVPLPTWFEVLYEMTQSKKGISALQVHRMIDPVRGKKGSYRTAWYMCHRIRAAMQQGGGGLLGGFGNIVEIDEAYIGGNPKNRHGGSLSPYARHKRAQKEGGPRVPGTRFSSKVPVLGAIARKGNVVAVVADKVTGVALRNFVRKTVSDEVSLIATDAHPGYRGLSKMGYPHESVNHQRGEYVRGVVHTSHLDSFWSLLKRGIVGNYHKVSKDYLPLYLNEFAWRHNNRNNPDIFDAVLAGC
jgi:transposase-like protein